MDGATSIHQRPCPALHFEKEIGGFFFDPMPSEKHEDHEDHEKHEDQRVCR